MGLLWGAGLWLFSGSSHLEVGEKGISGEQDQEASDVGARIQGVRRARGEFSLASMLIVGHGHAWERASVGWGREQSVMLPGQRGGQLAFMYAVACSTSRS